MPPRYLRRASPTRLKPCQERMIEACDAVPADQCCGVIPCTLCLEWEAYGSAIQYGSASFATSSWTGTVGGHSFVSYWQRNYDDECEYIVTLDGHEVYRATCYEGASCRHPAGEVDVTFGDVHGTLRWSVYEPRELELVEDPDTGCRDFFCGECRCSCECVCVTITEYGTGDVITGELCDTSYDCDAPVWSGAIGYSELSIALGRDVSGACIITLTIDGEEQNPVFVTGCASMTATVTLSNGDVIEVACKQCACEQTSWCPCCPGWPENASGSIAWTIEYETSDCGGGDINPTGDFSCPNTGDTIGTALKNSSLFVRVFCDNGDWKVQYRSPVSGGGEEFPSSTTWVDAADVDFVCPSCPEGTGSIDFIAIDACETSGGVVSYPVLVHGLVTIGC